MRTRIFLLSALAAVALAAGSVTAIAVALSSGQPAAAPAVPGQTSTACRPALLAGTRVTVVLSDMGAMMNGGMMRGLGEASNDCAAGAGEGTAPGDASWVTIVLKPGRYEALCNLAGHYAAGMYAELDVT